VTAIPRLFDLLVRRRVVVETVRSAEPSIGRALWLVHSAQARAMAARDAFVRQRGARAMPDPDGGATDRELIAALDNYRFTRELVELPGAEVFGLWRQCAEDRRHVLSWANTLAAVFSREARARYAEHLNVVERSMREVGDLLPEALPADALRKAENPVASVGESLQRFRQNSAAWIAALEHLATQRPTSLPAPAAGRAAVEDAPPIYGGLPAEIAARVETTPLQRGPLSAILRRYQEFGSRYLVLQGRCVLGDDMGLGKTVQVLAAMCHAHVEGAKWFFVVAPNSVVANWEREVRKHTRLHPIVVHGADRDEELARWKRRGGVAITTYGTVGRLTSRVEKIDFLAVDEAHYAKNPDAQRTQAVANLASRSSRVVLMTGTALENRLAEMGSLITLAQPGMRDSLDRLIGFGGRPNPRVIRTELAPVYLRRTQADVLVELPERIEIDEWVEPSEADLAAYRNTPAVLVYKRIAATVGDGTRTSAKYERLKEIIDEHLSQGRKVLVFSFFLQVIADVCDLVGGAAQITGGTSHGERQRIIDEFTTAPDARVLVGQIDAGGIGVNLQAAQVVIIMEPQLKPSSEWHAIARAHRMGQSKTVTVHRLMVRGTIEERIVELLRKKTEIFRTYADDSAMREASSMATDSGDSLEAALERLLKEGE
jgi:SNF2 family DNA or RNA helicase